MSSLRRQLSTLPMLVTVMLVTVILPIQQSLAMAAIHVSPVELANIEQTATVSPGTGGSATDSKRYTGVLNTSNMSAVQQTPSNASHNCFNGKSGDTSCQHVNQCGSCSLQLAVTSILRSLVKLNEHRQHLISRIIVHSIDPTPEHRPPRHA